jgi:N utilization substance protein A
VRGSRIRNIVDELGGEKIDIVRWNESSQVLISNALKPAEVKETFLCFELGRATVVVDEEQLSLAIGKRGQNVRLAARLTGWDIDIMTPAEYNKAVDDMERTLKSIEGVEDVLIDKLLAIGVVTLADLAEVGTEPLVKELDLQEELANRVVEIAASESKRIAEEEEAAKKAAAERAEAEQAAAEQAETESAAPEAAEAPGEAATTSPTEDATGAVSGSPPEMTGDEASDDADTDEPVEQTAEAVSKTTAASVQGTDAQATGDAVEVDDVN